MIHRIIFVFSLYVLILTGSVYANPLIPEEEIATHADSSTAVSEINGEAAIQQEVVVPEPTYLTITTSEISALVSLDSDPYFSWFKICADPEGEWLKFALQKWSQSLHYFVDFSPGFGRTFIPLAKLSTKISFSIIKHNDPAQPAYFHNVQANDLSAKVLSLVLPTFAEGLSSNYYRTQFEQLRQNYSFCPDLVHVQYLYDTQLTDIVAFSENFGPIIKQCRSHIYLDTNATYLLSAISEYLHAMNYTLEYSDLCSHCDLQNDHAPKNIRWFLYATPKPLLITADKADYIPPPFSALPTHQAFETFFEKTMKFNQLPECIQKTEKQDPEPYTIRVPWSLLSSPTSPLHCFPELLYDNLLQEKHELVFAHQPAIKSYARRVWYQNWRCHAWTERMRQQYHFAIYHTLQGKIQNKMRLVQCMAHSGAAKAAGAGAWSMLSLAQQQLKFRQLIDQALDSVPSKCVDFSSHQFGFLEDLRRKKYVVSEDLYAEDDLPVEYVHHVNASSTTVTHEWFQSHVSDQIASVESEREDFDDHYDDDSDESLEGDSSASSVDKETSKPEKQPMKYRRPLQTLWEPEVCDEPLNCRLSYEFQRRLFVWQNPDHKHVVDQLYFNAIYAKEEIDANTSTSIPEVTSLWPKRTCANAKYLIYNPWSKRSGLGSMWEQIAAAMRYALCHDRIFILYTRADQEGSIRKWAYPGCLGNVWECYFRRISSCPLTDTDFDTMTHVNAEEDIGSEYLSRVRILSMRGMLTVGACAACNSTWPMDSSFFTGMTNDELYSTSLNLYKLYGPFMHYGYSLRHVVSTQFIRYFLQPQPWLEHLLPQIVSYTMLSPVAKEKKNDVVRLLIIHICYQLIHS